MGNVLENMKVVVYKYIILALVFVCTNDALDFVIMHCAQNLSQNDFNKHWY